MNEMLDRELLDNDYKVACRRMAEAMLIITMPEWKFLSNDTKRQFEDRLIAHYLEDKYVPKHS